jgi:hypothetical protein
LGKKLPGLVEIFNFVNPLTRLLHSLNGLLGTSHLFHRLFLPPDDGVFSRLRRSLVVNAGLESAMVSVPLEFIVDGVFIRGHLDLL